MGRLFCNSERLCWSLGVSRGWICKHWLSSEASPQAVASDLRCALCISVPAKDSSFLPSGDIMTQSCSSHYFLSFSVEKWKSKTHAVNGDGNCLPALGGWGSWGAGLAVDWTVSWGISPPPHLESQSHQSTASECRQPLQGQHDMYSIMIWKNTFFV